MEKRVGGATPIPSAYLNHTIFVVKTVLSTFAVNNAFPCIIHTHTHASTVAHIQKTAAAFTLPSSLAFRTSAKVWRFAPREPGSGNCNPGPGNYLISIATAIAGTNIHKNWFVNSLASLRFFAFAFVLALLHLPYRRLPRTRTSAGDQCCQVRVQLARLVN